MLWHDWIVVLWRWPLTNGGCFLFPNVLCAVYLPSSEIGSRMPNCLSTAIKRITTTPMANNSMPWILMALMMEGGGSPRGQPERRHYRSWSRGQLRPGPLPWVGSLVGISEMLLRLATSHSHRSKSGQAKRFLIRRGFWVMLKSMFQGGVHMTIKMSKSVVMTHNLPFLQQ